MSERIVSPGVFTREKDLSFLPQGISDIGAAIIGPTSSGPAFVPTIVNNFSEFESLFGKLNTNYYTPYTIKEYLKSAGTVTVVRILGIGGYTNDFISVNLSGSCSSGPQSGSLVHGTAFVLKPSRGASDPDTYSISGPGSASLAVAGTAASATLTLKGTSFAFSTDTGSANYITNVFSEDPQSAQQSVYVSSNFKHFQSGHGLTTAPLTIASGSDDFTHDYKVATTPSIQSQLVNSARTNLFKVNTRSHGTNINHKYKIGISDVKAAVDVAGSDYGSFTLSVIVNNPGENDDGTILESFQNLSFDEDSVNYVVRAIGDRYVTIDSLGKLTYNGDYPNKSKYIYLSDYSNLEGISVELVPMGFGKVSNPVATALNTTTSGSTSVPTAHIKSNQLNSRGEFDSNVFQGFNFANEDNKQYLAPLPASAVVGNNITMSLEDLDGHADASTLGTTFSDASEKITLGLSHVKQRKFVVPFQGGFDGYNPAIAKNTGNDITSTNTMGFDCSTSLSSGSVAYSRAINAVSNPDEFDINMVATPGIIHEYHSSVTNKVIDMVESRADAFYVMDGSRWGRSIDNAVADIKTLDSNYAATYFPWVKVLDEVKNKPMWVPPSVVIPGVIANTDAVAHEWFAPAGLNRGGLSQVLEAKTRLTHAERDDLYEGRVNPIASFPAQGVVVFGQKTLQAKPSALDRINVRRLLIRLRKFIASSSRYLVFEQNTAATRNRFLGIVNPFLEQVQANSGLSAFRVVMDDSNNTPDVVDRNQLVGQIFIQPTRTAEFIVLDFVVQPTGAAFPE
tara:strand:+ start:1095 stop:3470 length:2376 start_codon:yes stop_codon:yes gene_type:complete